MRQKYALKSMHTDSLKKLILSYLISPCYPVPTTNALKYPRNILKYEGPLELIVSLLN